MAVRKASAFLIVLMLMGVALAFLFISSPTDPIAPIENFIDRTQTFFIEDEEPGVGVSKGSNQVIPSGGFHWVTWTQEDFDTDSMANLGTDDINVSVPQAGTYQITANLNYEGDSVGARGIVIYLNGGFLFVEYCLPVGVLESACDLTRSVTLAAGDEIGVKAYQTAGHDLDINGFASRVFLQVLQE